MNKSAGEQAWRARLINQRVRVSGLTAGASDAYNGMCGTVLSWDATTERYHIRIDGRQTSEVLKVKPLNVSLIDEGKETVAKTRTLKADAPTASPMASARKVSGKAPKPPPAAMEKKELTPAQKAEMECRIRAKVSCDKAAYDLQWLLLEPGITERALTAAAEVLQPAHYDDITEERALDGLCGYPPCTQAVPNKGQGKKLHVSLSERKVFDISHLHNFCGRSCAEKSKRYAATLNPTALFLRTGNATTATAAVDLVKREAESPTAAAEPAASSPLSSSTSATASAVSSAPSPPPPPPHPPMASAARRLPASPLEIASAATASSQPVEVSDLLLPADRPPEPPRAKPTAADGSPFDAGATLGAVVERTPPAPSLTFATPAGPAGAIEGYASRIDKIQQERTAAALRPEKAHS